MVIGAAVVIIVVSLIALSSIIIVGSCVISGALNGLLFSATVIAVILIKSRSDSSDSYVGSVRVDDVSFSIVVVGVD